MSENFASPIISGHAGAVGRSDVPSIARRLGRADARKETIRQHSDATMAQGRAGSSVVPDGKLAEQCRRLVMLIGDGRYRDAAHVLETAFDWNAVAPGWAYWSMVHHKLKCAKGPDRVTVITPNGPLPSETVPMAEFLLRLKEATKHVRGGSRD